MAKKSKWVNSDKFNEFKAQKKDEIANESKNVGNGFFEKWKNPVMGTQDKAKIYKVRLLPDKNQDFYRKYYYHFFKSGDSFHYIKCPKTENFENFCPWCYANQLLWKGNKSDKEQAKLYKRNERFVGNVFIVDDPRDVDADSDKKVAGTTKLYEFPATVESKIKNELTNEEEGFGPAIFDPESGHDFLIKILAKKPDENGKIWPDYSLTEFSRKPSAIAKSDDEINEIMEGLYDLTEYINSMDIDWSIHEKLLKSELIWDDVEDMFKKRVKDLEPKRESSDDSEDSGDNKDLDNSEDSGDNKDLDEEELMNELKNM